MKEIFRAVVALVALQILPGCCLMLGNTQTAHTLEKGTGEVGLTFGATTYQFGTTTVDDPNTPQNEGGKKETLNVAYPVILPEIPFGIAVTDDVQVGGRLAPQSLGFELNTKWRFLHHDQLHMAVMPSINYQSWLIVQGTGARLPLLVTYDINDTFSFTTSAHVAYTNWDYTDKNFKPDSANRNAAIWAGGLGSFGMGICPEIHTDSFFFRPAIEFNRYQSNFSSQFESTFEAFNSYGFMVNIGWVIGKTKKQLDRMEKKIDRLLPPPPVPQATPPTSTPISMSGESAGIRISGELD